MTVMGKLSVTLVLLITITLVTGCSTTPPAPKLNPLQIQAMQTREFTASKKQAFNAVITALQNEGYALQSTSYKTGVITALSPTMDKPAVSNDNEHLTAGDVIAGGAVLAIIGAVVIAAAESQSNDHDSTDHHHHHQHEDTNNTNNDSPPQHTSYSMSVSGFITSNKTKPTKSKIRLSLVQHAVTTGNGTVNNDTQVLDAQIYQKLFNAIRQQLFVAPALH